MQRVINRFGLPAVLVGVGALFAVCISSLILAVGYRNQLTGLRHTIYTRCVQRSAYDDASQQARAAQATYYRALLANLRAHPSPQAAAFNVQLERNVHRVIVGLQAALDNGAPKGCAAYR